MRYRKPFTLDQRQDAGRIYRSWKKDLARIRHDFRPRNNQEWETASAFRKAVREFAHALAPKDAKVDVDDLNRLFGQATKFGIQYAYLRNSQPEL